VRAVVHETVAGNRLARVDRGAGVRPGGRGDVLVAQRRAGARPNGAVAAETGRPRRRGAAEPGRATDGCRGGRPRAGTRAHLRGLQREPRRDAGGKLVRRLAAGLVPYAVASAPPAAAAVDPSAPGRRPGDRG